MGSSLLEVGEGPQVLTWESGSQAPPCTPDALWTLPESGWLSSPRFYRSRSREGRDFPAGHAGAEARGPVPPHLEKRSLLALAS